ncbi:MAG: HD domain-containing protein [Pseudobutyrivibrio sp.]|mgnify:FL=1|nr:HD domain-containing protein [Pseudobutyrivibrio sp.]
MILTTNQISQIEEILSPYIDNPLVQSQHNNIQHGTTTMYEHCMNVVKVSVYLDARLGWKAEPKAMIVGAFLHDFFLYDWHTENPDGWGHSVYHPVRACKNAVEQFDIDKSIQNVILAHMWPWPVHRFPASKAALIVCLADKYCSIMETFKQGSIIVSDV